MLGRARVSINLSSCLGAQIVLSFSSYSFSAAGFLQLLVASPSDEETLV